LTGCPLQKPGQGDIANSQIINVHHHDVLRDHDGSSAVPSGSGAGPAAGGAAGM
jgi:hypothetical protein